MKKERGNVITVENQQEGLVVAKDFLYKKVDSQTLLFLSGGSTPKDLYETLAKEGRLKAKAVGMVDERIDGSNLEMIKETGLLAYLKKKKVPFYPILRLHPKGVTSDIVRDYNKEIKHLLGDFSKSIAIMGIGEDGHTAGLPASPKLPRGEPAEIRNYVTKVSNFPGEFKERITLTFKALSKMDLLIILAFGESKKKALQKMFEKGPLEEIPARFFMREDIAKKTILITDQKI